MKPWPTKQLGELCDVRIGRTPRRDQPRFWGGSAVWVTIGELNGGKIASSKEHISDVAVRECMPEAIPPETLLFSFKLSIGKMAVAGCPLYTNEAIAALPIRHPSNLSRDFLRYALLAESREGTANSAVLGKVLNKEKVQQLSIPVPPLAEQERIVKLLDEADELRKLRAQADRRTAALIAALFQGMFGDPEENPRGWPVLPFGELLAEPLRNGLSPSKDGRFWAKVFTLSAITGAEFDSSAWKEASFARQPDRNCRANESLFLICRGNGNRDLVGRAKFPQDAAEGVVFPDTMIAGVPKTDRLLHLFLEEAWRLPSTRGQISSGARTTNGTFKINQTVIEQIRLTVPPLPLQKEFASRVGEIRAMQTEQAASRRRLDDLFQSMLHRALRAAV